MRFNISSYSVLIDTFLCCCCLQEEDGIRDKLVTGVQTCALPISDRLACRFLEAGIAPLDRVVVQLPNGPEFVYTYFALTRIGAIPVTALRAHRHTEVRHFVRASGATAYVLPDRLGAFDYREMAGAMQSELRGA